MARFKLFLGEKPIKSFDDFKIGVEAPDSVEKYRSGAIQRWLRENGRQDVLAHLEDLAESTPDGKIVRVLLNAIGKEPKEVESGARRILRKRNIAIKAQEQDALGKAEPVPSTKSDKRRPPPERQPSTESVSVLASPQFSLEEAFALAVQKNDIENLCRDYLGGGTPRKRGRGEVNWTNIAFCDGWRIQRNDNFLVRQFASHCRILDPKNMHHAHGAYPEIEAVFRHYWESQKGRRQ